LGAVLGFLGLGIFEAFSGVVAYWFLGAGDAETATKLEEVRREVASALSSKLERIDLRTQPGGALDMGAQASRVTAHSGRRPERGRA
jgi:hypothetical protein